MPSFEIHDSIKMLRETLCRAQWALRTSILEPGSKKYHTARLQRLINECDRHRPLGVDGKHGNLHTQTCGCLDKGPESTWETFTPYSGTIHIEDGNTGGTICGEICPISYLARPVSNATCEECQALFLKEN